MKQRKTAAERVLSRIKQWQDLRCHLYWSCWLCWLGSLKKLSIAMLIKRLKPTQPNVELRNSWLAYMLSQHKYHIVFDGDLILWWRMEISVAFLTQKLSMSRRMEVAKRFNWLLSADSSTILLWRWVSLVLGWDTLVILIYGTLTLTRSPSCRQICPRVTWITRFNWKQTLYRWWLELISLLQACVFVICNDETVGNGACFLPFDIRKNSAEIQLKITWTVLCNQACNAAFLDPIRGDRKMRQSYKRF